MICAKCQNQTRNRCGMKTKTPFKELFWFASQALDKIYNESPQARKAVVKHYGIYHYPYSREFKLFQRKLKKGNTQ